MQHLLAALAFVAALVTGAGAATFEVRFTQPDCADIARWELWGARSSDSVPSKRADILASALAAPCSETDDNVATINVTLRRGPYTWTLRAVGTEGDTADSNTVVSVVPMPKPTLKSVITK